jgi:hypothetical protein
MSHTPLEKLIQAGHWKSANISRVFFPDQYVGVGIVLFSFGIVLFAVVADLVSHEVGFTPIFELSVQDARRSKKGTINKNFFIKK